MELKSYQKRQLDLKKQKAEDDFQKDLEHATKT